MPPKAGSVTVLGISPPVEFRMEIGLETTDHTNVYVNQ